jgi:4-hydroxythreonine-4-phosphate dehydrogenase
MDKKNKKDKKRTGKPPVAITMGDPAGVGPELSLRILTSPAVRRVCVPIVFGDAGVLRQVARRCRLPAPRKVVALEDWRRQKAKARGPMVVDLHTLDGRKVQPGCISAACGRAAYAYIRMSAASALAGQVAAVVTNPIHKESLNRAGVDFPGHTEIFQSITGAKRVCMMLVGDKLAVSFVTTHVGYADVPRYLSRRRILDVIELTHQAMSTIRGRRVRLAVCGLNPHAGEHGLFGRGEEQKRIEPAIQAARARGIEVTGPWPPDTAFLPQRLKDCDAVVCMYHDQGHIPFKMLAFDTGVNITLGLPIVRTSVDHGTAFDIAWRGRASAKSLISAVRWAVTLTRRGKRGGWT